MFAYCENDPVNREDPSGEFAQFFMGLASQYVGDVIGNILDGKKGWDVIKPTSSPGEYFAAGITSLIPGGKIVSSALRAGVTTAIMSVEKKMKGEEVTLKSAMIDFGKNFAGDYISGKAAKGVSLAADKLRPNNYSQFAHKIRIKHPNGAYTRSQINTMLFNKMRRIKRLETVCTFSFNSVSAAFTR